MLYSAHCKCKWGKGYGLFGRHRRLVSNLLLAEKPASFPLVA